MESVHNCYTKTPVDKTTEIARFKGKQVEEQI